jgi:hypothetical protein
LQIFVAHKTIHKFKAMGKIPNTVSYQYQILRYRYDVTSGEFANIGLVYFDPQTRFLRVRMIKSGERLIHFWEEISESHLLNTLVALEEVFNSYATRLLNDFDFRKYKSVEQITRSVLPVNDNALQFSDTYSGFDFEHECSFVDIYNRVIGRYNKDILEVEKQNMDKRKRVFQNFMSSNKE